MARDGIADVTYVNPGYQPGRFPIIAVGQIPFTFTEGRKGHGGARRLVSQVCRDRDEGHAFLLRLIHDPGAYHGRKKVVAPRTSRA